MSDRDRRDDPNDLPIVPGVPGVGAGGQAIAPDENSIFGPDPEPDPDARGVNEEDVSTDAELMDAGESPEFDHSLRKRSSGS